MNKTDDIANEMAGVMAEMAADWAADDAERARKYRIASIFLGERIIEDLQKVKKKAGLRDTYGSYVAHQKKIAMESLDKQINNVGKTIEFLRNANDEYFVGEESDESKATLIMFADYFRGDAGNLKLAKISTDLEEFKIINAGLRVNDGFPANSVADVIVASLESSIPDIFNNKE